MPTANSQLTLKEKLAVLAMLLLLATLAASAYAKKHSQYKATPKNIHVTCLGACVEAKSLEFSQGSCLADLVNKISLHDDADLGKMALESRLKDGQVVIIPKKGGMSLYVTGAVDEPRVLFVPEGLHFNQLKQYITLADDADLAIFHRRRRVLCEGETIHIPSKSEIIVRK